MTVRLSDGRDFDGVVLGTNWVTDIGLVKITESGVWPFAKIVDSSTLGVGDPVVACGYPAMTLDGKPLLTERNPKIKAVTVRQPGPHLLWYDEFSISSAPLGGGSSGGGVFDSKGCYVGAFLGSEATRSEEPRFNGNTSPARSRFPRPGNVHMRRFAKLLRRRPTSAQLPSLRLSSTQSRSHWERSFVPMDGSLPKQAN